MAAEKVSGATVPIRVGWVLLDRAKSVYAYPGGPEVLYAVSLSPPLLSSERGDRDAAYVRGLRLQGLQDSTGVPLGRNSCLRIWVSSRSVSGTRRPLV